MRFEVPQFIEVEDKIFGPFTWRQFLYLGGGVGGGVVMFITLPFIYFVIFGIPLILFALALSFYQVNNRSFSYFLEAIFNYVTGQNLYLWRRKSDVVYHSKKTEDSINKGSGRARLKPKKDISSLARKLELQALQISE